MPSVESSVRSASTWYTLLLCSRFLERSLCTFSTFGPGTSTLVLVYHIYNEAFISWDLGYSSTIAFVLFLIVLAVTLVQFRFRREEV